MKFTFSVLLIFFSSSVFSCVEEDIPIEIKTYCNKSDQCLVSFKALLQHNDFYLLGAQYNDIHNNTIPMYMGYQEAKNVTLYELSGTIQFFKSANVLINYGVKGALCAKTKSFNWEQMKKACENC